MLISQLKRSTDSRESYVAAVLRKIAGIITQCNTHGLAMLQHTIKLLRDKLQETLPSVLNTTFTKVAVHWTPQEGLQLLQETCNNLGLFLNNTLHLYQNDKFYKLNRLKTTCTLWGVM